MVDKVIREIDVRTKQVLIEAFIVEANSSFERVLGNALSGAYTRKGTRIGGTVGGSSVGQAPGGSGSDITGSTAAMTGVGGEGMDGLYNFPAESVGSNPISSGIGI